MTAKPLPPIDLINSLYSYDPDTGRFTFADRDASFFSSEKRMLHYRKKYLGTYGDNYTNRGYRKLFIKTETNRSEMFSAHRIAFFISHGYCPNIIDHINGDRSDNRICNLRPSNVAENSKNKRIYANNTSGYTGIKRNKNGKRWTVQLNIGKIQKHLGVFDNIEEAIACYEAAKSSDGYTGMHGLDLKQALSSPSSS